MAGVIFIRTLTEEQVAILENVKINKGISASTKAIQYIITDYAKASNNEEHLRNKIRALENTNFELANCLDEYKLFFKMFSKLEKGID